MIEKLIENGIDPKVFNYLDDREIKALGINIDDCLAIVNYLKSIGIQNISELLVNKVDLFLETKTRVEALFNKKDVMKLVSLINDDIQNVYLLYE